MFCPYYNIGRSVVTFHIHLVTVQRMHGGLHLRLLYAFMKRCLGKQIALSVTFKNNSSHYYLFIHLAKLNETVIHARGIKAARA
jgi:hypothetical protein